MDTPCIIFAGHHETNKVCALAAYRIIKFQSVRLQFENVIPIPICDIGDIGN